ncbi:S8 family serine peptidase [Nonomuraea recticatena]|uniref:S8 family serine peptidase n=1 Tax=Nonomuraea recticatena TaxID=46178 RepID=UPI00360EBD03
MEQARTLAHSDTVGTVFLDNPEGVDDLGDSVSVAYTKQAHSAGYDGNGIFVAVWEKHPDAIAFLDIEDQHIASAALPSDGFSAHATAVTSVIKNTRPSIFFSHRGHAPNCRIMAANTYSIDSVIWATEARATVINQSFHRVPDEAVSGVFSADDVLLDWLALHPPFPTIVSAAGNTNTPMPPEASPPQAEFVNHKSFNTLKVGNHNDTATAMAPTTVFRNPSSTGDRELPELAANGTTVQVAGADGMGWDGTSFSAPAVAGAAALIQDADRTLEFTGTACRAILLASADRNVSGQTWQMDLAAGTDAADGSGALNTYEAVQIAAMRGLPNGPPRRRGWDHGVITSDTQGFVPFVYRVRTPSTLIGPVTVKVALTWTSKVRRWAPFRIPMLLDSRLEADLDLLLMTGTTVVSSSSSLSNNYEIVEFVAPEDAAFDIRIRVAPHPPSPAWRVGFGIAWTVFAPPL